MNDFIDQIIKSEGGDVATNDSADSGGRTQYGISENANPDVWADGKVTYDEARTVYQKRYIDIDGISRIPNLTLMHQVADFGATSSPVTSVRTLQQILGVQIDGKIGPATLDAISKYPDGFLFGYPVSGLVLLNLAFRDARVLYYVVIAKRWVKNLKFILGWINRVFEFK